MVGCSNAAANGLTSRASFERADLFEVDEQKLAAWGPFDKMLIDPPRSGAAELVKALPDAWPSRAVSFTCPAIPRPWRAMRGFWFP